MTRKGKLLRNVVCVLLLLIVCYRLADCPPLTAMHAFRQAERQNLAGPSEVIARISGEAVSVPQENLERFGPKDVFGNLGTDWTVVDTQRTKEYILGEKDGTFYCFWWEKASGNNRLNPTRSYLFFREKTGDTTVMPVRTYRSNNGMNACVLYIQTELEEAVTASVEVREVRSYKEQYYSDRCSGEGAVHENGVFVIAAYQCAERSETTQEHYESMKDLMEVHLVLKNAAGDVIYDETVLV